MEATPNPSALDTSMGPSGAFGEVQGEDECNDIPSEEALQILQEVSIQEVLEEAKELRCTRQHYLVNLKEEEGDEELELPPSKGSEVSPEQLGISGVLILSTVIVSYSRVFSVEPLIDYSKSILLTSFDYLRQVKSLVAKHSDASKAKEARKVATEQRKRTTWRGENYPTSKEKEHEEAKADKAREKAYWADVASRGWGNKLQGHLKSTLPPPLGSYRGVYMGTLPT